jgi:hypothetical protein
MSATWRIPRIAHIQFSEWKAEEVVKTAQLAVFLWSKLLTSELLFVVGQESLWAAIQKLTGAHGSQGAGCLFCAMFVRFAWGEFMSKQIIVTLEDGRVVVCAIVERSYRHDASARAAWDGREFVAVRRGVMWREWAAPGRPC